MIESFTQRIRFIQEWNKWLFLWENDSIFQSTDFIHSKIKQVTVFMRKWLNLSLNQFDSFRNETSDSLVEIDWFFQSTDLINSGTKQVTVFMSEKFIHSLESFQNTDLFMSKIHLSSAND